MSWREDRHVRVDVLYGRLKEKWRIRANLLFSLWALIFSAALTWYGFVEAKDAFYKGEASVTVMALPTFPVKAFIPIGAFLLCLQIIRSAWQAVKAQKKLP
jgi:TRAP-type C4-dicarboxylate transport system permease small subunit